MNKSGTTFKTARQRKSPKRKAKNALLARKAGICYQLRKGGILKKQGVFFI